MNWIMLVIAYIFGAISMFMMVCIGYAAKQEEPVNKVRFYVARDKNGALWLYLGKPIRKYSIFSVSYGTYGSCLINKCHFKYFGLNENDFDNLKWEDEPLEVFVNMED